MPSSRKVLAADAELASELLRAARRIGVSLYNLTNRLIEAYLSLESSGYPDPVDAALELALIGDLTTMGFRLCPPPLDGGEAAALGEMLWRIASSRERSPDPKQVLVKLASLLVGRRRIMISVSGETRVVIGLPEGREGAMLAEMLTGFARAAFGERLSVHSRANVLELRISEPR